MDYNTRRAIIRRVKQGGNMKTAFSLMKKDSKYKNLSYSSFLLVREDYLRKQVQDGYKWCNVCGCEHPYTYEVFGYNGFNTDGTRRLHSVCLNARSRIRKNIIIMRGKQYEAMKEAQRRNRIKNQHNWSGKKKIADLSPEEQEKQRDKRRKYSADKYLRLKNVKKKTK